MIRSVGIKDCKFTIGISGCNIKEAQEDDGHIKESNIDSDIRYPLTFDISRNKRIDRIYDRSKFDDMYPFNEIKLSNIRKTICDKTEITYSDESEFKRDCSNEQIMVEILKLYLKRYRDDHYEYIEISKKMKDGYELDSAFIKMVKN